MLTLDPAMKNLLIETVGGSLVADQVEALGQMLLPDLNIHDLSGKRRNFTLSPRMAAQVLTEHLIDHKQLSDYIKLLIEMDEEVILGKEIRIEGLEYFLKQLSETGLIYDSKKRKVVTLKEDLSKRPDWGVLKNGRNYDVTVGSMDIVGSSELVKKFGRKTMEKFYSFFWATLGERLGTYDGRIWSWAGDGGILAFAFKNHRERATRFAYEMQRIMPLVNAHTRNPISESVAIRIGLHSGKVAFMSDTGKMISDVINLAAHLEKKGTQPGFVSITESIWKALPSKLQDLFDPVGDFEGKLKMSSPNRLDVV
ncbi:MAG: adenylate/guanylate cyclase domain-containing protein [Spirochaetes bacterium]|nr:MAG: adenylate/guanylate cyclase domain-containing protein [Spirochaetota bacterium]RKX95505.1 MAG: adenylate/guanylate cyclase domain-containing protein [Spirochaetota bacterium]